MKELIECSYAALLAFGFVMSMAFIYGLSTASIALALFSLKCLLPTVVAALVLAYISDAFNPTHLSK